MAYHSTSSMKKLKKKQQAKALAKHQEKLNAILKLPAVAGNTSAKAGVMELLAKSPNITIEQVNSFVERTYAKPLHANQNAVDSNTDTLGQFIGGATQTVGGDVESVSKRHAREVMVAINGRDR